jgi:hypothetical protein
MNRKLLVSVIGLGLVGVVALFLLIQLVPYGRNHTNPAVVSEPNWNSPQTRELAVRACYDCHSNQTFWPRYSNIAPFSWLIQRDVDEGRRRLNFSTWGQGRMEVDHSSRLIQEGEMPPFYYVILHPSAKLSSSEQQTLINGLSQIGGEGSLDGQGGDD